MTDESPAEKVYPPPADFAKTAWIKSMDQYREMYERSIADPDGFWAEVAEDFYRHKK